jgi:hypothetical protein
MSIRNFRTSAPGRYHVFKITISLLSDINTNTLSTLPKRNRPLRDSLRVQHLVLWRNNALDIDQPDMNTAVAERTIKALHHVLLARFHQAQGEQLWDRVPGEVAVSN